MNRKTTIAAIFIFALLPCFALADGWKCEFSSYIIRQEYVDVPYSTWNPGDAGDFGSIGSYGSTSGGLGSSGYSQQRYRRELQNVRYDYPTQFYLYDGARCIYEGTVDVTITNLTWGKSYIVQWYSPSTRQWKSEWVSNNNRQSKIYMNLD